MDNRKITSNPNPKNTANIFEVLTFSWTYKFFKKSYYKALDIEDLYDTLDDDKSDKLGDQLEKQWFAELERSKRRQRDPSLLWTILRTYARSLLLHGCLHALLGVILRLASPMFLGALLQYFKPVPTVTYESALLYAAGITVSIAINAVIQNHMIFLASHLGGLIRIGTCSAVYRKALRLSKTALGETAPGKIVNLISNDVSRFEIVLIFCHFIWSAPLVMFIIMGILYSEAGWSPLIGVVLIMCIIPFQGYLGILTSKYRLQTALKTDARIRLMDEIISGVQVIKMYAWEKPFCAMVELARRLELKVVRKSSYIRGIYMTFFVFTARLALFGTLMAMMFRGQEISADRVFTYLSYFNIISFMSSHMARAIGELAECKVSIARLQNFLMLEEIQSDDSKTEVVHCNLNKITRFNGNSKNIMKIRINDFLENGKFQIKNKELSAVKDETINIGVPAIKFKHIIAKWDACSTKTILDDVDLEVSKGDLYVVIGMVGSGKSSFMSAILGELKLFDGSIEVNGRISYADQNAWVFGSTVRQNILFGQEFDKQRYTKVIKMCALEKDFEQFPNRDQTIVGERGTSLSGGQKARINLARAIYRDVDIYLLDDPLSAVDAHVGKHLFEECIQKYLFGKTRILATHQLQYIKSADVILLLNQGKMYKYTNYHELLLAYPEYKTLITDDEKVEYNEEIVEHSNSGRRTSLSSVKSSVSTSTINEDNSGEDSGIPASKFYEKTSRGRVKGSLLLSYLRYGAGILGTLVLLFLFMATQLSLILHDYFIPVLVNAEESRNYYNKLNDNNEMKLLSSNGSRSLLNQEDILPKDHYMYLYTALMLSIFFIGIIRSFYFCKVCLTASQCLHDLVFGSLIRATMRFFDTNPSGSILNRFSKDLGAIDELLPKSMLDSAQIILTVIGSIIIACIISVYFVIPTVVVIVLFILIRKMYLQASQNIKRLEGTSRSPVFTHMNATLNGIATIRAYEAQNILKKEFDQLQDTHTCSWYMFISASAAFGFLLDLCSFVFIAVITFSFLLFKTEFTSGEVGLVITQIMSLMVIFQIGILRSAEVANQLMAVERLLEYSQLPCESKLRREGILTNDKMKARLAEQKQIGESPKNWPTKGLIRFQNMSMRYSDDEPAVLQNLTFTIHPSEKIGVVGRTGAGKSSLVSALFRLTKVEGVIEIDGVDADTIALEVLRKHISIIPQDPILFSGTLRRNLDPFTEFPDEILWKVLEEVELKDAVKLTGNGLDHRVMDRGSNYSTGQRQLICLARAILRNNRILMLDEATANVDPQTDALIQRTIRTKFASCTVLTVAHRLNTIMDSDKVLFMDKGRLIEFDHPHILLQNQNGPFSLLVKETGPAMFEHLSKVANDAYFDKNQMTR